MLGNGHAFKTYSEVAKRSPLWMQHLVIGVGISFISGAGKTLETIFLRPTLSSSG
jgi:hypothetical protein